MPMPRHRQSAFTLIEMLVVMAIASFMIFVFYQIFNEAVSAMRSGVQISDMLKKSQAFQEQLEFETETVIQPGTNPGDPPDYVASRMLGPRGTQGDTEVAPGGLLMIINRAVPGVAMSPQNVNRPGNIQPVRSDQLFFIYNQTSPGGAAAGALPLRRLSPLAPARGNTFGGDPEDSVNSDYVRIWYGHVVQTNPNGSFGGDLGAGPNQYAVDWALGRQAMFMLTDADRDGVIDTAPAGNVFVTDPGQGATALNPYTAVQAPDYGGTTELRYALSDIAADPLTDVTLNNLETTGASGNPAYLGFGNPAINNSSDYNARALALTFNNDPLVIQTAPAPGAIDNEAIARMHPLFMSNVSDFIVEWAHDYDDDDDPSNGLGAGPDGKIDRTPDGDIRWYSYYFNNPTEDSNFTSDNNYDSEYPTVYLPPLGGLASPYQQYAFVNGSSAGPRADAAFVWGHFESDGYQDAQTTAANANQRIHTWPWMIRIRYRLHDRRGSYVGRTFEEGANAGQEELGQWFEIIVPVNRQPS